MSVNPLPAKDFVLQVQFSSMRNLETGRANITRDIYLENFAPRELHGKAEFKQEFL